MSSGRKSEYHQATLAIPVGIERLWAAMRSIEADNIASKRVRSWSVQDVAHRAKTEPDVVRPYVRGLRTAGYLVLVRTTSDAGRKTPFYQLVKPSREAPRVRPDGRELPELAREILWRSMKLLKGFSIAELAAAAHDVAPGRVKVSAVKRYVIDLTRVGVLTMDRRAACTEPGRYRLVKSLGAAAPRVLRAHVVFDPNADQVLGVAEAREAS